MRRGKRELQQTVGRCGAGRERGLGLPGEIVQFLAVETLSVVVRARTTFIDWNILIWTTGSVVVIHTIFWRLLLLIDGIKLGITKSLLPS